MLIERVKKTCDDVPSPAPENDMKNRLGEEERGKSASNTKRWRGFFIRKSPTRWGSPRTHSSTLTSSRTVSTCNGSTEYTLGAKENSFREGGHQPGEEDLEETSSISSVDLHELGNEHVFGEEVGRGGGCCGLVNEAGKDGPCSCNCLEEGCAPARDSYDDDCDDEDGDDCAGSPTATEGEAADSTVSRTKKYTVSFDSVELRSYPVMLGDNPSVTSGPPVTIGWVSFDTTRASVDDYESYYDGAASRRVKSQMLLPRTVREDMLKRAGYSRGDFRRVDEEVQKIKRTRRKAAESAAFAASPCIACRLIPRALFPSFRASTHHGSRNFDRVRIDGSSFSKKSQRGKMP